jgi:hypothetical protein
MVVYNVHNILEFTFRICKYEYVICMLRAGLLLRKGFSPLISHNLWKVYAVPKNLWTRSNANQEKRNGADGNNAKEAT